MRCCILFCWSPSAFCWQWCFTVLAGRSRDSRGPKPAQLAGTAAGGTGKGAARQQAALAQQNEAALRSVSDALQTAVQNMSATLAQGANGPAGGSGTRLNSLQQQNAQQMEQLRNSLNEGMKALQEENARKLDEIRQTWTSSCRMRCKNV